MTKEEFDFIGALNMCDEISNEAYKKIMCHCEEQESCEDCISRNDIQDYIAKYLSQYLYNDVRDAIDDIDVYIGDMPSVQPKPKTEWIPCSERLPEEREWYLAIFKEKDTGYQLVPRVADYIGKGKNKWRVIDEEGLCQEHRDILECIAWMPLPEPYKESEG